MTELEQLKKELEDTHRELDIMKARLSVAVNLIKEIHTLECDVKECKEKARKGQKKVLSMPVRIEIFDNDEEYLKHLIITILPEYKDHFKLKKYIWVNNNGDKIVENDFVEIIMETLNKVEI